MEAILNGLAGNVRLATIEACAKIADAVALDAEQKALVLTYGESYGMDCRADGAKEIAEAIRALAAAGA